MANEPKVPEARDDDPEEVADKLSIALAMWTRGDRPDALNWMRRAAESASDAELDVRALEIAKAVSELAAYAESAPSPAAKPSLSPSPAPAPSPSAAGHATPKKPTAPPARAAGGKLPPLPPMRPLGTVTSAPPAAAPAGKAPRLPSMVTSATGSSSASGTVEKEEVKPAPHRSMPWDDQPDDDEPTNQLALTAEQAFDPDATREIAAIAMQPAREVDPSLVAPRESARDLALAVGVRVRLIADAQGVRVVPEGAGGEGISALVVPLEPGADLRALFQRRA